MVDPIINCDDAQINITRTAIENNSIKIFEEGILSLSHQIQIDLINLAIKLNRIEIVELYIEIGLDLNLEDSEGNTPLVSAILDKNIKILNSILKSGKANIHQRDSDGNTALLTAVSLTPVDLDSDYDNLQYGGNNNVEPLEIVNLLLDFDADPEERDDQGATTVILALECGCQKVAQRLIPLVSLNNLNSIDQHDNSALVLSISYHDSLITDMLLDRGVKVGTEEEYDLNFPLGQAAKMGRLDLIEKFLAKGAKINTVNKFNKNAVGIAAQYGYPNIIEFLIEKGGDFHGIDGYTTPLMLACRFNKISCVQILIKNKVRTDIRDSYGCTVFSYFTSLSNEKDGHQILKLLVEAKANTFLADKNGVAPIHLACGLNYRTGIRKVYFPQSIESFKLLFSFDYQINQETNNGKTALTIALENGYQQHVEFLIQMGARPFDHTEGRKIKGKDLSLMIRRYHVWYRKVNKEVTDNNKIINLIVYFFEILWDSKLNTLLQEIKDQFPEFEEFQTIGKLLKYLKLLLLNPEADIEFLGPRSEESYHTLECYPGIYGYLVSLITESESENPELISNLREYCNGHLTDIRNLEYFDSYFITKRQLIDKISLPDYSNCFHYHRIKFILKIQDMICGRLLIYSIGSDKVDCSNWIR